MKVITIQDVKINLNKWGRHLVFLAFFIQITHASPLKIAILDTGFCPELLKLKKNVTINPPIDLTSSVHLDCQKYSTKNRRFHGHWVLEQFLRELKLEKKIQVTPLIIFDQNGSQRLEYWKRAFNKQSEFHLIISAAGITQNKRSKMTSEIKRPIIVAGATLGRGIKESTILWPQSEFKNPLVTAIGSYLPKDQTLGKREDYTLLRKNEMSYFFSAGRDSDYFRGSSRAVATASARAINICFNELLDLKNLKSCLKRKSFKIKLDESAKSLPSF